MTREAGGTTNLYKTQYAYSWIPAGSGGGRELVRTEQQYSGGAWANDNKLTYKYDALERQNFEQRHDWQLGAWSSKFDTTQEYDKNGNRTRYHRNIGLGGTASYGRPEDLSYTFNNVNALTQATDADDSTYLASFTCDANGNITQVDERMGTGQPGNPYNHLYTYFEYDDLNRLSVHKDKRYVAGGPWLWTKRSHGWDGLGRLVHSNLKTWNDGGTEPTGNSLEHIYAGSRHVQNYDGTSNYGAVWHWAGAGNDHGAPLKSPNPDTASQNGYNTAVAGGAGTPQRRTFVNPTTEGNKRELFAQGRPEAKDSSGSGANWYLGTQSAPQTLGQNTVESRFFFTGTVVSSSTDMSRATDKREKDRMGIFGTSNSYAGSYGRVTSESIGRDLNPLGRGSGQAFVAGGLNVGLIAPALAGSRAAGGTGNSINNPCTTCTSATKPANVTDPTKPEENKEEPGNWAPCKTASGELTGKCCVMCCGKPAVEPSGEPDNRKLDCAHFKRIGGNNEECYFTCCVSYILHKRYVVPVPIEGHFGCDGMDDELWHEACGSARMYYPGQIIAPASLITVQCSLDSGDYSLCKNSYPDNVQLPDYVDWYNQWVKWSQTNGVLCTVSMNETGGISPVRPKPKKPDTQPLLLLSSPLSRIYNLLDRTFLGSTQ